jgi:hypothetical protein
MRQKKFCIECQTLNVERSWKSKKFNRPNLKLARYYSDSVENKPLGVVFRIGLRGSRSTTKANVWQRLPDKGWKCLRLDYPDTELAKQKL